MRHAPSRRVLVLGLAALSASTITAACGDEDAASDPPAATTTVAATAADSATTTTVGAAAGDTPAATTAVALSDALGTVDAEEFTLSLPEEWNGFILDESGTATPISEGAAALPPELEQIAIASALQGGKLFAVPASGGMASSATLLVTELGPDDEAPGGAPTEALVARLAEAGLADVEVTTVDLPAGPAARATYRQTQYGPEGEITMDSVQVYVPTSTAGWLLTLQAPQGDPALSLFDGVAESFMPR